MATIICVLYLFELQDFVVDAGNLSSLSVKGRGILKKAAPREPPEVSLFHFFAKSFTNRFIFGLPFLLNSHPFSFIALEMSVVTPSFSLLFIV